MPWFKLEINFHLPDDCVSPQMTADDIEAMCYQVVMDYADETGLDLVMEIDEEDKNI